nr:uncharacterized protein LOC113809734 [Penaeus vannamei]
MQISAEKTKLMTNATNNINSTIKINDEKVEDVQSFKYLGAIVTDEGSLPESSKFLYACESWTLTAEKERKIQAMEMRNYRRFLGISYTDRITNEEVRKRIRCAIGPHDELLKTVKQRKLRWAPNKEKEGEVGRGSDGSITSKNGQAFNLEQIRKAETEKNGEV